MPDLAKIAYEAWCERAQGNEGPWPAWTELPATERDAWDAAAQAVLREWHA